MKRKVFREFDFYLVLGIVAAALVWAMYLQTPQVHARTLLAERQYHKGSLLSSSSQQRWLFIAKPLPTSPRQDDDILNELASLGKPAIPTLIENLQPNGGIGQDCGKALIRMGPQAVPAVAALLNDPNPNRRMLAAWTLGGFGVRADSAVPSLVKALGDSSGSVRCMAALSLNCIDRKVAIDKALPVVLADMKDPTPVQFYAAWALRDIGPATPEASEAIEAAKSGPNSEFFCSYRTSMPPL